MILVGKGLPMIQYSVKGNNSSLETTKKVEFMPLVALDQLPFTLLERILHLVLQHTLEDKIGSHNKQLQFLLQL